MRRTSPSTCADRPGVDDPGPGGGASEGRTAAGGVSLSPTSKIALAPSASALPHSPSGHRPRPSRAVPWSRRIHLSSGAVKCLCFTSISDPALTPEPALTCRGGGVRSRYGWFSRRIETGLMQDPSIEVERQVHGQLGLGRTGCPTGQVGGPMWTFAATADAS